MIFLLRTRALTLRLWYVVIVPVDSILVIDLRNDVVMLVMGVFGPVVS